MIWDQFKVVLGVISHVWNSWGIELLVSVNFVFQVILTYNGRRRRHTRGLMLRFSVWFAYLLTGKVATLVLNKLMTTININHNTNSHVQALLAPLMLIQMGSPDTITAYSMEDNQLGWRQVFNMVIQVTIMFYIIIRSWTEYSKTSFLYLPLTLVGIIKYGETTWALKSAIEDNFNFTIEDFLKYSKTIVWLDRLLPRENEFLPQAKFILRAYYRFCCLRPHLENWIYYPPLHFEPQRLYIDDCEYEEAFKITDCELGFMYDALYTKAPIIYTRKGLILRFISFFSLIATLCGYSVLFNDAFVYDIRVGFIHFLLIATVILEVYQILRLPFTDWAIVQMILQYYRTFPTILFSLLQYVVRQSATSRSWSNTMSQFNLIDFCLATKHRNYSRVKILVYWGLGMELRERVGQIEVHSEVKQLVVEELKEIEKLKRHGEFTERGKWTMERYKYELGLNLNQQLITIVLERPFDKNIFIWHVTTSIFYHSSRHGDDITNATKMDAIMNLSDYMMSLLMTRSYVLSTPTGKYISRTGLIMLHKCIRNGFQSKMEACKGLVELLKHKQVEGNWSLLRDVKVVTNRLLSMSHGKRWELIGSLWVEMLGYAATNCEMKYHLQHIRKGGELITHVWLLIAHTTTKFDFTSYREGSYTEDEDEDKDEETSYTSFSLRN